MEKTQRIADEWIEELKKDEIFVFGSNLSGFHGAGAAKMAHERFGAKWGQGIGRHGSTYAIPTKDAHIKELPISAIKPYVEYFYNYAVQKKKLKFLVTEVGCGLAGHTPETIAPLFKECINLDNVYLPISFINIIKKML